MAEIERDAIITAIEKCEGRRLDAARLLDIGKTTLYRKLSQYGIVIDKKKRPNFQSQAQALSTVKTPRFLRLAVTTEEIANANAQCPSCQAKIIL